MWTLPMALTILFVVHARRPAKAAPTATEEPTQPPVTSPTVKLPQLETSQFESKPWDDEQCCLTKLTLLEFAAANLILNWMLLNICGAVGSCMIHFTIKNFIFVRRAASHESHTAAVLLVYVVQAHQVWSCVFRCPKIKNWYLKLLNGVRF